MGMYIAALAIEIAFVILVIASFASVYLSRRSGAPFYPTRKSVIRQALTEAGLRPGESFYDLGAGTGKALLIAEKEFGAHATGFEISTIFYIIGKINLLFHGSRATLIRKNLFDTDLKNADVIFCFLAIRTMQKMEDKIKTGLKPGARVIVYAFPLPTMTPTKTIAVHGKWNLFIYHA
jgi:SAM-dependent methyltransferase